jgi:hypothetical protein
MIADNRDVFAFDDDEPVSDVGPHMNQTIDFVATLAMLGRIGPKNRDV